MKKIKKVISVFLGPLLVLTLYYYDVRGPIVYYPAVLSFMIGSAFFLTGVVFRPCLIERFAEKMKKKLTLNGQAYCRKLNACWVVILYSNAVVSFLLAWFGFMKFWAIYNGLLSYLLIFGFTLVEYAYRQKVIGKEDHLA